MPMAPARAMGPRIQKAIASPSGTSACFSSPAARTAVVRAWLMIGPPSRRPRSSARPVASDFHRVAGERLAGDVGRALRLPLLQRGLRLDGVVVLLVVAEPHRVRRGLHAGQQRSHQLLLRVDELLAVVEGQLVLVRHRQRAGGAGLDAQAAEDAAQVVDLVHRAVALTRGVALGLGVVAALDVDGVRRARPRAELAADALLQAVRVPVEDMPAVVARLRRVEVERVLLGVDLLEHRRERQPEALGEAEWGAFRLRWRHRGHGGVTARTGGKSAAARRRDGHVSHRHLSSSDSGSAPRLVPAPTLVSMRGGVGTLRSSGGTGKVSGCSRSMSSSSARSARFRARAPSQIIRPGTTTTRTTTAKGTAIARHHTQPSSCRTWMEVMVRIQIRLIGMRVFQPNAMNWS